MSEIEARLLLQKQEACYREWLKELRTVFVVKVNEELLEAMEIG